MKIRGLLSSIWHGLNGNIFSGCKTRTVLLILLLSTYWMIGKEAASQINDSVPKNKSWLVSFENGLSYAGAGDQSKSGWGLTVRVAIGYEQNGKLLSAGFAGSAGGTEHHEEEYLNDYEPDFLLDKHDQFFEAGIKLGGKLNLNEHLYFAVMTGTAVVIGRRIIITEEPGIIDYTYVVKRENTDPVIGIPVEAGVNYNYARSVDVGFRVNMNFNKIERYYGITLNVIKRFDIKPHDG